MPAASVNGVSLDYEEAGHGPPLLFIHAFSAPMTLIVDDESGWLGSDSERRIDT